MNLKLLWSNFIFLYISSLAMSLQIILLHVLFTKRDNREFLSKRLWRIILPFEFYSVGTTRILHSE